MGKRALLFSVAGGLAIAAGSLYGWRWFFSSPPRRSPEELVRTVLEAPKPEQRQAAAIELLPLGSAAVPHMRKVLEECSQPEIRHERVEERAAMIQGLAQERDFDSMELFLNALDDESVLVRARAAGAVERLLQVDFGYRAEDPPEKRREAVAKFRKEWELLKNRVWFRQRVEELKRKPAH